jgi:segregation and condensation protein A
MSTEADDTLELENVDEGDAERPKSDEPLLSEGEGGSSAYRVQLPAFEGPLDLLLHLIQKHELDILNIPIGFVTEKYLEYITLMQDLSIDIASEYLVMAATLAHLKSKSLLPPSPEDQEEGLAEDEEDPRTELIRRLLEYQKYKLAAEELGGRAVLGRDVFARGAPVEPSTEPAALAPINMFQLMDAFQAVLERSRQLQDHQVDFERISITERISELCDLLRPLGEAKFDELFIGQRTRADLIVTFLAILEMTRLRMTRLRQDSALEPIYVELAIKDVDLREEGSESPNDEGSEDLNDSISGD